MTRSNYDPVVKVFVCVNILGTLKKRKENLKNLIWKRKIKVNKNKQKLNE